MLHGGQHDWELTMRRYALRDDQWDRIKDLLPGREGHVGVTAKDNRLFVEAVLYRYRAGIPWRDLPERFGDPETIHTRFSRWAKSGVWEPAFISPAVRSMIWPEPMPCSQSLKPRRSLPTRRSMRTSACSSLSLKPARRR